MNITPIVYENTSSQIYNQLLNLIISGEWRAGSRLPTEMELAEKFRVSRAPVREALQRLRAIGLISAQQGRGTFVCSITPTDVVDTMLSVIDINKEQIRELLEFRAVIEPYCVQIAAKNADEELIEKLKKYVPSESDLNSVSNKKDFILKIDVPFHRDIVSAAKNFIFVNMFDTVISMLQAQIVSFLNMRDNFDPVLQEHNEIFNAIVARDPKRAAKAMRDHITYLYRFIDKV